MEKEAGIWSSGNIARHRCLRPQNRIQRSHEALQLRMAWALWAGQGHGRIMSLDYKGWW